MWKTIAPIVTGLSLLLAVPAPATEKGAPAKGPEGTVVRAVVLKGVLRHVQGELQKDPPMPFEYWQLDAGGKTYYLDLRGKQLLERAEKLVNRPVVVTGLPDPASPTLRVTDLKADEFVNETVHVEIRGRLESYRHALPHLLQPWPIACDTLPRWRPWPPPEEGPFYPEPAPILSWWVYLGDKYYQLDFGSAGELLERAKQLDHKGVIVTGTRLGEVIRVTSIKADDGTYRETVTVMIQGELSAETHPTKRLTYIGRPTPSVEFVTVWYITVNGKKYQLDFRTGTMPAFDLNNLKGRTVVVTGMLKDDVVAVTSLQPAGPWDPGLVPVAAETIDGVWDSNWGPVTIKCGRQGNELVPITGSWVQGPGMEGVIKSGTFDPARRILRFVFDEPWHNQSGTAVLSLSADGKTLSGTWKFTDGGSGSWTMTRR
jgi:hypothetical protein